MPAPTTMTLRRDVLPASPCNPRLSRALRLRIAFAMLSLSHRAQAFDVIHVNGSADHRAVLCVYPFLKRRPRLVLTKHNALKIKRGAWLRMHYGSDAIIAVSQTTRRHLLQAGLPAHKVATIPNGIDTQFYQPVSPSEKKRLRAQYGFDTQNLVFVSNAGTARCKNWLSLLKAIATLPSALRRPIRVLIAGALPSTADHCAVQHFRFGFSSDFY